MPDRLKAFYKYADIPIHKKAPASPVKKMIVFADRVHWDPLNMGSGGAYLVMYLGSTSGWGAITGQLD